MEKKKNWVIGALIITVVLMSVGYAALAQTLTINGTANIGDANWDIEITGIEEGTLSGATTESATSNATSATFSVDLAYPGASASYNVAIENKGTIDAVLESISGVDTANAAEPAEIQYSVTGVSVDSTLDAGATTNAIVTVTWVKSDDNTDTIPETTTKSATITLNYVQNTQ